MAAATSSRVAGTPPPPPAPVPTRRYSMFQAVQPRAARSAASGRPSEASYAAFQKPPWMTTTTPRDAPSGRVSSAYCDGSSP